MYPFDDEDDETSFVDNEDFTAPMDTMGSTTLPLDELVSKLASAVSSNRDMQDQAQKRAHEAQKISGTDIGMQAGLGLLPILIGALIKGKKGGYAGAQAGLAGQMGYAKNLKEEHSEAKKLALTEAKIYGDRANKASDKLTSLQGQDALKTKYPSKGMSFSIDNKMESEASKLLTTEVMNAEFHRKAGNKILDGLEDAITQIEKAGVAPEKGETWADALGRNVKGAIDPNSPEGRLQRKLTEQNLTESFEMIKGAATEPEQDRMRTAQGAGYRVSLDTLKQIIKDKRNGLDREILDLEEIGQRRKLTLPTGDSPHQGKIIQNETSDFSKDNPMVVDRTAAKGTLEALQKQMGYTTADIEKLLQDGEIVIR